MKIPLSAFGAMILGLAPTGPVALASDDSLVTAVFSSVSNGYTRTKTPDGSFKRETYAISNGGYASGLSRDHSIDEVKFPALAGLVAEHLARRNYFLAQDAKSADLLLVISWGTTIPFNDGVNRVAQDNTLAAMNKAQAAVGLAKISATAAQSAAAAAQAPEAAAQAMATAAQSAAQADAARNELDGQLFELQMSNDIRSKANERNARLLGYMQEINSRSDPSRYAGAGTAFDDLVSDIESERYYVIVTAYDFRAATQGKKLKQLWSTRVSIQTRGNRFDENLATMLANASRHFGQDSGHLIRQSLPQTRVDLGELKILGTVPAPAVPGQAPPEK